MEAHWTARGLFNTRPEAEELLRKVYAEHGVPVEIPTRDDAIEKLVNSKAARGHQLPGRVDREATNGGPAVINYPEATATRDAATGSWKPSVRRRPVPNSRSGRRS